MHTKKPVAGPRKPFERRSYGKAYELTKKMQGYYSESYLPLADLVIRQSFADASPTNYTAI